VDRRVIAALPSRQRRDLVDRLDDFLPVIGLPKISLLKLGGSVPISVEMLLLAT